jgi:hypothetical protein
MTPELNAIAATSNLYDTDFYAWTQEQAKLLSQGAWERLDIPNLVEEIESLGKQQRQELRNRLGILIGHLLKWEFQAERRSKSWFVTIREQRRQILDVLAENPSLKPYLPDALEKAYKDGVGLAVGETPLNYSDFPSDCPYALEEVVASAFLPGQPLSLEQQDWS